MKIAVNALLLILVIWFLVTHEQKIRTSVARRDSMAFWAAGKLLVHRQNPYSVPDVMALQRSEGYDREKPLMMRPMPWSLWMVLPLGLVNSFWAWVAWLTVLLASLVLVMRMSWRMYGAGSRAPDVFVLGGYLFAPVAACLSAGQMGLILALGITLFLFLEQDYPILAGAALVIPLAKPHLLLFLWPILALWAIRRKRWAILGGFAAAFFVTTLIAWVFDPAVFQHYRGMLHQQAIQNEFIPSVSGVLRVIFFRNLFWVQFVPACIGLLWCARYYWKHCETWNWREHGPALLILSVVTAPYSSWMSDEAILLPAILQGLVWLNQSKLKIRSKFAIGLFVFLDLFLLLLIAATQSQPASGIYFWSSLVWFGWYWYARSFSQKSPVAVQEPVLA